jgi:hypothetical protein
MSTTDITDTSTRTTTRTATDTPTDTPSDTSLASDVRMATFRLARRLRSTP